MDVLFSGLMRKKGTNQVAAAISQPPWWYVAYLHNGKGTINTEGHIEALEQRMLPYRWLIFQGRPRWLLQDNTKPHLAQQSGFGSYTPVSRSKFVVHS